MGKCSLQKGKHSGMFHCTCCNAIHIGVVFALVCFHCFLEHSFARFIFIFEFSLFYVEKLQEFVKPLVCFLCFPWIQTVKCLLLYCQNITYFHFCFTIYTPIKSLPFQSPSVIFCISIVIGTNIWTKFSSEFNNYVFTITYVPILEVCDKSIFPQMFFVYIFISKGQAVSLKVPFPNSENYGNET